MKKTILSMITLAAMMMAAPTQVLAGTSAVEMIDLEAQDIAVSYTNGLCRMVSILLRQVHHLHVKLLSIVGKSEVIEIFTPVARLDDDGV